MKLRSLAVAVLIYACINQQAFAALQAYGWPGNVRELQNCVERAVLLADTDALHPRHFNLSEASSAAPLASSSPWEQIDLSGSMADASRRVLVEVERRKITQALRDAGGNRQKAADALGLGLKTLSAKIDDYRLD